MDQRDRALYIISVAAELAGVHAQTLRIYERKGLIEPRRTEGGSRRYSDRDITLLRRIQDLTNEGVSLVGVRKILDLETELEEAQDRIDELEADIEALRREQRERIEAVHRQYRRALVPVKRAVVQVRR
jgi:MerR family transcriptional regulator/heat shock protein HspR